MTQPMHSSGFAATQIPLLLHSVFEDYVPSVQGRFPATGAWDNRFKADDADKAFVGAAKRGNDLSPALMKSMKYEGTICTITSESSATYTGHCFPHEAKVDEQIGILLKDAYQSMAGYLYATLK